VPYPEELKQHLGVIYPILFKGLEDSMPLLRQGSAASLANLVEVYEDDAKKIVLDKINGINVEERMGLTNSELCASCKDSKTLTSTTQQSTPTPSTSSAVHMSELPGHPVLPSSCPACTSQPWHLIDGYV